MKTKDTYTKKEIVDNVMQMLHFNSDCQNAYEKDLSLKLRDESDEVFLAKQYAWYTGKSIALGEVLRQLFGMTHDQISQAYSKHKYK